MVHFGEFLKTRIKQCYQTGQFIGQKLVENAKIQKFKCDILSNFQSCFFIVLGPMVISWKKSDGQGGPLQYLATGTHRLTSDTRVSVEESNEQGSTLVISFANDQDVGDYVCEVSSNPPATLRHHVSLIGNHHHLVLLQQYYVLGCP